MSDREKALRELPKMEALLGEEDSGCDWVPLHLVLALLAESGPEADKPWLYAIEETNAEGKKSWHDGENCVFHTLLDAQEEVDSLNDNVPEGEGSPYEVVPLYRAAAPAEAEKRRAPEPLCGICGTREAYHDPQIVSHEFRAELAAEAPASVEREAPAEDFDIYGHGFPPAFIAAWEHRERQFRAGDSALRELRELSEKATKGPWYRTGTGACGVMSEEMCGGFYVGIASTCVFPNIDRDGTMPDQPEQIANAMFIAACVNYVRRALATQQTKEEGRDGD